MARLERRSVSWTDRLDRLLTHRFRGTLVFLAVMFLVFNAIFLGAKPLMDLINAGRDAVADWVGELLLPGPFASLLTQGVIKASGAVVVFLPQILILFAFIAVLEDCGYMGAGRLPDGPADGAGRLSPASRSSRRCRRWPAPCRGSWRRARHRGPPRPVRDHPGRR
ncbi:MAG: hypothetical protein U0797_02075 [Gemmataceae bacterium]